MRTGIFLSLFSFLLIMIAIGILAGCAPSAQMGQVISESSTGGVQSLQRTNLFQEDVGQNSGASGDSEFISAQGAVLSTGAEVQISVLAGDFTEVQSIKLVCSGSMVGTGTTQSIQNQRDVIYMLPGSEIFMRGQMAVNKSTVLMAWRCDGAFVKTLGVRTLRLSPESSEKKKANLGNLPVECLQTDHVGGIEKIDDTKTLNSLWIKAGSQIILQGRLISCVFMSLPVDAAKFY